MTDTARIHPAAHMATVTAAFGHDPIPRAVFEFARDADIYAEAYAHRVAAFAELTEAEILAYVNESVRLRRVAEAEDRAKAKAARRDTLARRAAMGIGGAA